MTDAAEARRKRMEKIKARKANEDVLSSALLNSNLDSLKSSQANTQNPSMANSEFDGSELTEQKSHTNTIDKITQAINPLDAPFNESDPLTNSQNSEKKGPDAFERYRAMKDLEKKRKDYIKAKSLAIIIFALLSGLSFGYTGNAEHKNVFLTFLFVTILGTVGFNHKFKGSDQVQSVIDMADVGALNQKILTNVEAGIHKGRLGLEVLDDIAMFLVSFISVLGVVQFIKACFYQ